MRELPGLPEEHGTVRLGRLASAGAGLVPRALHDLHRTHPAITVLTREGSTPTLVRALSAGTLDVALLASTPPFRPPDTETPTLAHAHRTCPACRRANRSSARTR
ncbi:LysR substrate-binding domain-containing protein [Actinopolymorpha pittospori]